MPRQTDEVRILLVDDHAIFRQGLRMLVESERGFKVVGEAHDRAGALPIAQSERPDVVLLDLDFGTGSGLDLIPDLLSASPDSRILVLTGVRDTHARRRAFHLGAVGLVEKESAADVLHKAIWKVHSGEIWLDRATTASVFMELTARAVEPKTVDADTAKIATLTARERQVIALIAEGLSNKDLALRLSISETTVRHHLTSIFAKLEVRDRLALLVYAHRTQLLHRDSAST
jgi:DNA-binding NarL/FixJ family response regulator